MVPAMTAQIAYLHEHRPLPPISPQQELSRRLSAARLILREAGSHRPELVREVCHFLIEHGRAYDQTEAECRLLLMDARDRRQRRCAAPPPAVTMTRRAAVAEAASFVAVLAAVVILTGWHLSDAWSRAMSDLRVVHQIEGMKSDMEGIEQ